MLVYLDSSAIVKLVRTEPETAALVAHLRAWPERVSSALARLELLRALRRDRALPQTYRRASEVLARLALIRIDDSVLATAEGLDPSDLRALDAIHLATALSLGRDLTAVVTYDRRLAEAAGLAKLVTWSPQ